MLLYKIIEEDEGISIPIGSQKIPTWNTTGRPTGVKGLIGGNTDTGVIEWYDGSAWVTLTNWDARWVNVTGDTMTGALNLQEVADMPTASANSLALHTMDHQGITVLHAADSGGFGYELGRDNYFIARNSTASIITKGQAVYVNGATGVTPDVALAQADAITTSNVAGIAAEDIAVNGFGRCFITGVIENINTNAFNVGDVLYVSPTTAGGYTSTAPTCPNFQKKVAMVLVKGVGNGKILIRVQATFNNETGTNNTFTATKFRANAADYRRYYHLPLGSANPGASGATFVNASANTTGGWRLTNAAWHLRGQSDVHSDWDGVSDLMVGVNFMVNVDNTAGGVGDTVDLRLNAYYKGSGDTATKTQAVEVATVVGQSAQYKQFRTEFTIDYDTVSNVVEVGDVISFVLNLETDTSEVDDIVVTSMEFWYNTTHVGIESTDT